MLAIISLLFMLTLSLLVTRVATLALMYTGLSRQTARFQARSAFTGVGFTTAESEKIVNHPVRRRILFGLMLVGNAGVVTAVSTLILGFIEPGEGSLVLRVVVLGTGIAALVSVSTSTWVDRHLSNAIAWALKRYTSLEVRDYAALLHVSGEYSISELYVEDDDWMAGKTLVDLRLRDEGVMVLAVNRAGGRFVGAPDGATEVRAGDTLVIYGRSAIIENLDERRQGLGGKIGHVEAVAEQQRVKAEERREDADPPDDAEQQG